jgi:hypothetical protein
VDIKHNQTVLKRFEAGTMALEDLIHDIVSKHGLKAVANEIEVDIATLSRFKNHENGLKLKQLEKLLLMGDVVIVPRRKYEGIIQSWLVAAELVKELSEAQPHGAGK